MRRKNSKRPRYPPNLVLCYEEKSCGEKTIAARLNRQCAICGRKIRIILYRDRNYRGGHHFGKISPYRKGEMKKALKAGTRKSKIGNMTIKVLKRDPKPYAYTEYWERPRCYWK